MQKRTKTILAVLVLAPGALILFVSGLFVWASATAVPIHPTVDAVPLGKGAPPPTKWSATVDQARQLVRANVADLNLPGLSVAVGVEGEVVWAEGFGFADIHDRVAVTPETRFRALAASMALTSAGVGLLVEKNQLKLDDEIQTYVPEFPKKAWPVTLRQLMAHQGGIRNDGGDEAPIFDECARTIDGLQLDDFANRDLLFEPGTRRSFSTYGWILVSAAVEAAAHEPFFRFMRDRVFEPVGMADTRPDSDAAMPKRASFYHPRFAGDTKYGPQDAREGNYGCWAGGGAFLSTPTDLVRFGLAFNSGKIVQPATATLLQTQQRLSSGADTGVGLGWVQETATLAGASTLVARRDDRRSIGGATTLLTFPERGLVVAVMTNTSFGDTAKVAALVADAFARRGNR